MIPGEISKREELCFEIDKGKRKTSKEEPSVSRIAFDNLELCYITEPIMFAGINLYQRCLEETFDPKLIELPEGVDSKELKRIIYGTSFREVFLQKIPLHLGIYGNAFIETIFNENSTRLVELNPIDAKTMDFQRNPDNTVIFNDLGFPKGYVQDIVGRKIDLTPEECWHFTLHQINRGEMGFGFIEPLYKDITLKENIENAKAESAYRRAYPLPLITYGSEQVPPTEKLRARSKAIGQEIVDEKTSFISMPYFYKINFPELPKIDRDLESDLMYSTKLQAGVLGIPLALLTQCGADEGKGSLEVLIESFEMSLKSMQRALKLDIILTNWLRKNEVIKDDDFVEVSWSELSVKSAKEQIMRLFRLSKTDLLPKDEKTQAWVKRLVGMS